MLLVSKLVDETEISKPLEATTTYLFFYPSESFTFAFNMRHPVVLSNLLKLIYFQPPDCKVAFLIHSETTLILFWPPTYQHITRILTFLTPTFTKVTVCELSQ